MNIYTVIKEFSAPQLGQRLYVSDSIGKMQTRISSLVNGTEYSDKAFYDWIGSSESLNYISYTGTVVDPVSPGNVNLKSGYVPIISGSDLVTASGMAWDITPSVVLVTVIKPDSADDNIFATVRLPSISSDGFTADLSAPTSKSGYLLSYVVME